MKGELLWTSGRSLALASGLPRVIAAAGPRAQHRFLEFFAAHIRNPNTRQAYARACLEFLRWCDELPVDLHHIDAIIVAAYIEQHPSSKPTVKQHVAAIKMLFDWLVVGQVVPSNPTGSVRAPKQLVRQGKTSVLSPEEARHLLGSIATATVIGLRDRALIGLMLYTFARVSAAVTMKVEDVLTRNGRMWIRLEDKGGKVLELPAHHELEADVAAYLEPARDPSREENSPLPRRRRPHGDSGIKADESVRRLPHDPTTRSRCRYQNARRLPYLPCDGNHDLFEERRPPRGCPNDGRA